MFTGLVQALGRVRDLRQLGAGCELLIQAELSELSLGESIAVNGACLTVVEYDGGICRFQISPETEKRTNLGSLRIDDRVNLERALRLSDRLGGHLVQGHVDGLGTIVARRSAGEWEMFSFRCPAELAAQMVPKGSVAVDGVSLTLVEVSSDGFEVALIPHTLAHTTLGFKGPGDPVNLETDLLARYVWKCLAVLPQRSAAASS
jgi:riboflavin synthase